MSKEFARKTLPRATKNKSGLIQINAHSRERPISLWLTQNPGANMTEASEPDVAIGKQSDAATRTTNTNKNALHFMMGVQTAIFQEMLFAGYEMFDRARAEMHLFAECASKIAGAHSVEDIRTMWKECSRHQLEFVRRDCDRHLRHGDKMIETASKLFSNRTQD